MDPGSTKKDAVEIPTLFTVISSKEIEGFDTMEGIDKVARVSLHLFLLVN